MLLDNDILVDAGTGVGDLSLTELSLVDHIFLTHSHLDHIASIPFMVDTVGGMRDRPLTIWAVPGTLEILRDHIFNWRIWPDFAQIPSPEKPFLRYREIQVGDTIELQKRRLTALPANHVVPAVGYQLDSGKGSLVFTGDTTTNDPLGGGQQDLEPEVSDNRNCLLQSRKRLGGHLETPLSEHARRGTGEAGAQRRDHITHLKPGEIGSPCRRSRRMPASIGRGCCRTIRFSRF
jgi:glyoxylase-like metal-dependent hydrolase (beta-lactamase superfamily II)